MLFCERQKDKKLFVVLVFLLVLVYNFDMDDDEKQKFYELADKLSCSTDPDEQKQIKEELAQMTFGNLEDKEAIIERLEDIEDSYLADERIKDFKNGKSKTYTLDEVREKLGLIDD